MKKLKYYYNDRNNKIKIGYAIFRYANNLLLALAEGSFEMFFSDKKCCIFDGIPTAYFRPDLGDFIVKSSRKYLDLEILEYSNKSNYLFKKNE